MNNKPSTEINNEFNSLIEELKNTKIHAKNFYQCNEYFRRRFTEIWKKMHFSYQFLPERIIFRKQLFEANLPNYEIVEGEGFHSVLYNPISFQLACDLEQDIRAYVYKTLQKGNICSDDTLFIQNNNGIEFSAIKEKTFIRAAFKWNWSHRSISCLHCFDENEKFELMTKFMVFLSTYAQNYDARLDEN